MNEAKFRVIYLSILLFIIILLGIYFYQSNLFRVGGIVIYIYLTAFFAVFLGLSIKALWVESQRCMLCEEKVVGQFSDFKWRGGRPTIYRRFCISHFLEKFGEEIQNYSGKFIFLKNDKSRDQYFYVSTRDLRIYAANYSDDEISQIGNLINTPGEFCEKCSINKIKVILMDARAIEYTLERPLIKQEEYLKDNNSLCAKCFIDYFETEIQRRLKTSNKFSVTLPYDEEGIYLFEE